MNRIKDYIGFAIWFAGLGYIVLWPVTSPDLGGKPFGASIFCRDASLSVLDLLCNSAHPLQLPPSLHALGFAVGGVRHRPAVAVRAQALAARAQPPRRRHVRAGDAACRTRLPPPRRKPAARRCGRSSRARISACAACRAERNNIPCAGICRSRQRRRASSQPVNYRHAFHAGSFADVFKHAVLCRILHYLRGKPAAFRVIDTHAGAGLYDLHRPGSEPRRRMA